MMMIIHAASAKPSSALPGADVALQEEADLHRHTAMARWVSAYAVA